MREHGRRIERERIQMSGGVVGDLHVFVRQSYPPHLVCQLIGGDGESFVLPVLSHAKLRAIGPRGLLLAGEEIIPGRHSKSADRARFRQAWYCIPGDYEVRYDLHTRGSPSRTAIAA